MRQAKRIENEIVFDFHQAGLAGRAVFNDKGLGDNSMAKWAVEMTPKDQPAKPSKEFEQFDSFVRKLVSVPKAEIDKAEAIYQKMKKAKKKKKNQG